MEPPPGSPDAPSTITPDAASTASDLPAWAARLQHHREAVTATVPGSVKQPSDDEDEDDYDTSDTVGSLPRRNNPAKTAAGTKAGSRGGSILASASQSLDQRLNQKRQHEILKRRLRRMSLQQMFVGDNTSGKSVEEIKDLLLPGSKTRTYWEMLIAVLLLAQFVLSPYAAAFLLFPRRPFRHAWGASQVLRFAVDSAADVFYMMDICIRLRTYHFSSKGDLVLDREPILKRYLCSLNPSFSFVVDMAATLPPMLGEIIILLVDGDAWLAWGSIRWLLVLRMPRLVKSVGQILRACMTMVRCCSLLQPSCASFSHDSVLTAVACWL